MTIFDYISVRVQHIVLVDELRVNWDDSMNKLIISTLNSAISVGGNKCKKYKRGPH